jgi:hypothetical protein
MDLVVNSIVKSHMRNRRIKLTMEYFTEYRELCLAAQRRNPPNSNPCFNPPAPQLKDGIPGLFTLKNEKFRCPKYQSSIHRVFQSVGLAPIPTPSDTIGIFVTHQGPKSPEKYRKDLLNWQGDEDWQKKDRQIGGLLKCVVMKSSLMMKNDNDEEED